MATVIERAEFGPWNPGIRSQLPAGFLPLPVKFRIHFAEPLRFQGDPSEEDAAIAERVETVKQAIRGQIAEARAARRSWFW